MINYDQALKIIKQTSILASAKEVNVIESCGLINANEIRAKISLPSFDNSAMDGFALKSKDVTKGASVKLRILQTIEAGDCDVAKSGSGVIEIMTGAKMPKGYDAVIPVEKVEVVSDGNERYIIFKEVVAPKVNVRYAGEDFSVDDLVVLEGDIITPSHVMALTGLGISKIKARKMPKIAIIATGKEVVDSYDIPLNEGQIYNSNSPYLVSYLKKCDFDVYYYGIIADDIDEFHGVIDQIEKDNCDIIISTGAVSMGKKDFIKEELLQRKAKILFHKVAIRPGKPILLARLHNGRHFFGLPGNPISSIIGLQFFVIPFIKNCLKARVDKKVTAILSGNIKAKNGLLHFLKSHSQIEEGRLVTRILDGQQSFKIRPMIKANSLAIIDGGRDYKAGDLIEISPLNNKY